MKLQSSHLSTLALSLLLAISVTPALAQPTYAGQTATDLTLVPQDGEVTSLAQEPQVFEPVEIPLANLYASDTPRVYLTTDLTLAPPGIVPVDPSLAAQAINTPSQDLAVTADASQGASEVDANYGVQSEEVQVPQLAENQPLPQVDNAFEDNASGATPVVPVPQSPAPAVVEARAEPEQPGITSEQPEIAETAQSETADSETTQEQQEVVMPAEPQQVAPAEVSTQLTLSSNQTPSASVTPPIQSGSALVPTARRYTTRKLRPTKQVAAAESPQLPLDYYKQYQLNLTIAGEFQYRSYMLTEQAKPEPTLDNNPPSDAVEQDASQGVEFEGVPYGSSSELTLPTPIDNDALPVPVQEQPQSEQPTTPEPQATEPYATSELTPTDPAQVEELAQKFLAACHAQNQIPSDYVGLVKKITLPTATELAQEQAYQACAQQVAQLRSQLNSSPALATPNYIQTYTLNSYPKIGVNSYPSTDGHHRFPNNDAAHVWPNPSNPTANAPIIVDGVFNKREEIQLAGDQGLNESTRQVLVPEQNYFAKLVAGLKNTPKTLGHLQNIEQGLDLASKAAATQLFNQALIGTDPTQLAHSRYLFSSSTSDVTQFRSVNVPVSPANIGGFWPNPDPSLNNVVIGGGVTLNTWDERVLNPYARLIRDFQPTLTEIGTFVNDPHTGHSRFGVPFEIDSPVQPLTPAQRLKANEHRQVSDPQAYLARAYLQGIFAKYYGDTVGTQPMSMKQLAQALAQQGASEFVTKYHLLTIAPITDKILSSEGFDPIILAQSEAAELEENQVQGNLDGTTLEQETVPQGGEQEPVLGAPQPAPAQPAPVEPEPAVPGTPADPSKPTEPAPEDEDNPKQYEAKSLRFGRSFPLVTK